MRLIDSLSSTNDRILFGYFWQNVSRFNNQWSGMVRDNFRVDPLTVIEGAREENKRRKGARQGREGDGPGLRISGKGAAGAKDLAWMFCLGGQTLIPCRAPRCSTTKTRGHPPILSTSSRSLSTRYAFIPPAPRVWVMLLFIKPSFVNELNEGEGGSLPSHHTLRSPPAPFSLVCAWFSTPPFPPFARPFLSWRGQTPRMSTIFFPADYPPNSCCNNGGFMQNVSKNSLSTERIEFLKKRYRQSFRHLWNKPCSHW